MVARAMGEDDKLRNLGIKDWGIYRLDRYCLIDKKGNCELNNILQFCQVEWMKTYLKRWLRRDRLTDLPNISKIALKWKENTPKVVEIPRKKITATDE